MSETRYVRRCVSFGRKASEMGRAPERFGVNLKESHSLHSRILLQRTTQIIQTPPLVPHRPTNLGGRFSANLRQEHGVSLCIRHYERTRLTP